MANQEIQDFLGQLEQLDLLASLEEMVSQVSLVKEDKMVDQGLQGHLVPQEAQVQ
jgi:hypothetical protein